jgi:hypothetical protein
MIITEEIILSRVFLNLKKLNNSASSILNNTDNSASSFESLDKEFDRFLLGKCEDSGIKFSNRKSGNQSQIKESVLQSNQVIEGYSDLYFTETSCEKVSSISDDFNPAIHFPLITLLFDKNMKGIY